MKQKSAVTIIGGADGPTSVFVAGKTGEKNLYRRLKNYFFNKRYQKKQRKVETSIKAEPHTLQEVVNYITEKYGATELGAFNHRFECMKKNMKVALIQKKQPNLLGEPLESFSPQNHEDEAAVKEWFKKLEEYQEKAINIPDDVFPADYHLYEINRGKVGKIHVEIDFLHGLLGGGYSGDGKALDEIWKDIYLFYGVTKDDIAEKTERYLSYVNVLAT